MNLIEYADTDMMTIELANRIAGDLATALLHHPRVSLAVPGGTTPGPVFDDLNSADLDWARVDVLLTDERRVPPDHPRSNERLLRERLLRNRALAARFLRYAPSGDMDGADEAGMSRAIAEALPLSVLLLGMGADMHTASLFPGSPDLARALAPEAPAVMAVRPPGDDLEPRLTLTAPVLQGAISAHVVITGAEKRAAVERARHLSPDQAPIALVLGQAEVHWAP